MTPWLTFPDLLKVHLSQNNKDENIEENRRVVNQHFSSKVETQLLGN
jgi:hypothetical protein